MSKVAREHARVDGRGRAWIHLVCRAGLRARWRSGVARRWTRVHGNLFDRDDLALTVRQRAYHFPEWVAAIHFAETRRVRVVLTKWKAAVPTGRGGFKKYPEKTAIVSRTIGARRYEMLCGQLGGNGPDLFLYSPTSGRYWFAEVKKVGDRLHARQLRDIRAIERLLRVPVHLVRVHPR